MSKQRGGMGLHFGIGPLIVAALLLIIPAMTIVHEWNWPQASDGRAAGLCIQGCVQDGFVSIPTEPTPARQVAVSHIHVPAGQALISVPANSPPAAYWRCQARSDGSRDCNLVTPQQEAR
jgi:hypothetical protein